MHIADVTNSSSVAGLGLDGEDLLVKFTSGAVYRYTNARQESGELWNAYQSGQSVGKMLNRRVKGHYDYERVS